MQTKQYLLITTNGCLPSSVVKKGADNQVGIAGESGAFCIMSPKPQLPGDCAGFYEKQMAGKLHRNKFVAEQRARLLDAVRQTYADFFEDSYIRANHLYQLQVRPASDLNAWVEALSATVVMNFVLYLLIFTLIYTLNIFAVCNVRALHGESRKDQTVQSPHSGLSHSNICCCPMQMAVPLGRTIFSPFCTSRGVLRHENLRTGGLQIVRLQLPRTACSIPCALSARKQAGRMCESWRAEGTWAQSACDQALDKLTRPLHDWQRLAGKCKVPLWFRVVVRLGHGRFLGRRLLQQLVAMLCQSATLALAYTQVSLRQPAAAAQRSALCHRLARRNCLGGMLTETGWSALASDAKELVQAHELAERDFREYGKLASMDGPADADKPQLDGCIPIHVHSLLEEMRQNASQQVSCVHDPRIENTECVDLPVFLSERDLDKP